MTRERTGRRGRSSSEVVVIMWRDIPAQINGKHGDERHQVMLPHRFQKAIDRAAMVAGKKTAQDYIGEWRRTEHPLAGELVETVEQIAATIEREFTNERLHQLVANGGWDPASPETHDPEGPAS
ncbi:MAG: virulence factor [Acidimicrobiales bacterium]|nr:virulence factor [Acidimicrobiales bacterium]MCB9393879.1 virulence factor [Acidimicrobiaceae bacterium]